MTMTKKVAVINDLSGLGRCSLTAAISVLSAMGIQTCPLPTAILSSQTEYPSYYCYDFTDRWIISVRNGRNSALAFLESTPVTLPVYLRLKRFSFLDTFQTPDTFLLVDPVMGDDGMTYDMYTSEFLSAMKELTARADVITPNITEFCLLTDMDYNTLQNSSLSLHQLISCLKDASHTLLTAERAKKILITGIRFTTDDGIPKIGNLLLDGSSHFLSAFPCCDGSYSGTGDLFASCITGGLARGTSLTEMMQTAGSFLEKALADSVKEHVPVNEGVNFEKYLYLLH